MSSTHKHNFSRKQKANNLGPQSLSQKKENPVSILSFKNFFNWISAGLIILALLLIHKNQVFWGEVFLVIGVLAQFGQTIRKNQSVHTSNPNTLHGINPSLGPIVKSDLINSNFFIETFKSLNLWLFLLIAAGIFFFINLLAFPSHSWMFPSIKALPIGTSYWGLLTAWILMAYAMFQLPQTITAKDISPVSSRWLLLLILALGLFMVTYRPFWPVGAMTEDNIVHTTTSRLVNQLGDWKVFWDAGIGTNWPPFNSIFACFLWLFNPEMTGLAVQKLANVIYFLTFVLVAYLGAKEAVNRRAGLFAAAICAVCHPLITKSVAGLLGSSNAVTVMIAIWLFFRAMNRPKMANFLWWGAAVALSIYTYMVNRPFMFVVVISALIWILIQREEERKMDRPAFFLVAGTLGAFVLYVVYTNELYATDNLLSRSLDAAGYLLPCLFLGALWIMGLFFWPKVFTSGKYPYLSGWIAATWLIMILSFPRSCDAYEQAMLAASGGPGFIGFKPLQSLSILFDSNSTDWTNHHVFDDSFFGPLELTLGSVGLALAFVRPTLSRYFLVGVFFLFCAIWSFGGSYHTQRLQPCVGPLILLAGLAVEQIWSWLCTLTRSRLTRVLFVGLFSGLIIWTAQTEFDQVQVQWVDRFLDVDVAVWRRTTLDKEQGLHVFLGPSVVSGRGAYFLYENNPVEFLQSNNLITLDANQKLQDVVIYLRKAEPSHNIDDQLDVRIHNLFPDAKWEDLRCPWNSNLGLLAVRCVIPAADLLKSQDLFTVQTIPSPCWTRSYFFIENALRPGVLDWETRIAQPDAPPPNGVLSKGPEFVRYEGNITVSQKGEYEVVCSSSDLTVIKLDGKKIISMIFPYTQNFRYTGPGKSEVKSINLSEGIHILQITTSMPSTNKLADISWRHAGEKTPGTPIWGSFTWQ